MGAARVLEKNDGAADWNVDIPRRIAQKVSKHVARARGIALVVRVQQQHGVELVFDHHVPDLLQALGAQPHRVVVGFAAVVGRDA